MFLNLAQRIENIQKEVLFKEQYCLLQKDINNDENCCHNTGTLIFFTV